MNLNQLRINVENIEASEIIRNNQDVLQVLEKEEIVEQMCEVVSTFISKVNNKIENDTIYSMEEEYRGIANDFVGYLQSVGKKRKTINIEHMIHMIKKEFDV